MYLSELDMTDKYVKVVVCAFIETSYELTADRVMSWVEVLKQSEGDFNKHCRLLIWYLLDL